MILGKLRDKLLVPTVEVVFTRFVLKRVKIIFLGIMWNLHAINVF